MYNNEDLYQKLDDMENKIYQLEDKIDKLNIMLEKHIGFIDNTYEGLKNPIKMASRFFNK